MLSILGTHGINRRMPEPRFALKFIGNMSKEHPGVRVRQASNHRQIHLSRSHAEDVIDFSPHGRNFRGVVGDEGDCGPNLICEQLPGGGKCSGHETRCCTRIGESTALQLSAPHEPESAARTCRIGEPTASCPAPQRWFWSIRSTSARRPSSRRFSEAPGRSIRLSRFKCASHVAVRSWCLAFFVHRRGAAGNAIRKVGRVRCRRVRRG